MKQIIPPKNIVCAFICVIFTQAGADKKALRKKVLFGFDRSRDLTVKKFTFFFGMMGNFFKVIFFTCRK